MIRSMMIVTFGMEPLLQAGTRFRLTSVAQPEATFVMEEIWPLL